MIIVYNAANSIEAHMIKDLLEQQDIPAYIQGEHLQGGVGELPAIGLVKVSVDNNHYDSARLIIKEWESQEPEHSEVNSAVPISKEKQSAWLNLFFALASFVAGAIAMHWYLQSPVTYDGIDLNKDGKNDVIWTYKNHIAIKSEEDNNFDGKIDNVTTYENGLMDVTRSDENFDGKFETENYYQNERVSYSKSDTNNDNEIDLVSEFQPDQPKYKASIFNPKTNLLKKIQYYEMSKLKSAELDSNDDGVMDTVITYDFFEEEINRKRIESSDKKN